METGNQHVHDLGLYSPHSRYTLMPQVLHCCGLNIYLYNFWWKVWLSLAWLLAAGGGIDARTDSNEIKLMATGCRRVESTIQPTNISSSI